MDYKNIKNIPINELRQEDDDTSENEGDEDSGDATEDDGPLLEGTARGLAELFRTSPQSPAAPDHSSDT